MSVLSLGLSAQTIYEVSTFAGNGTAGNDNGPSTQANIFTPVGLCADVSGNIYVSGFYSHKIQKITPAGVVSDFAGSGSIGSANGTGTQASFNTPKGLCIDAAGNIYVSDYNNHKIRKITPAGVVSDFAGSGYIGSANGTGSQASFGSPGGLCIDAVGNIYVPDFYNHNIRKITPAGVVSNFAGSGNVGSANGTGTQASFYNPNSVCIDAAGNVYVADYQNHKIRKITPAGVVSDFAGSGNMGSANGTATQASFRNPTNLCIDATGNLYVADTKNNKIRKITQAGVVSDIAGLQEGYKDAVGNEARFSNPSGICVDAAGNIYIADLYNNRIRKITPKTPVPPKPNYPNLPGSLCMSSTVNYQPTVTGSESGTKLTKDSISIPAPKALCKNDNFVFIVNGNDEILRYDFNGNLISTFTSPYSNVKSIEVDKNGKIYLVIPDPSNNALNAIAKLDQSGNLETSWGDFGTTYTGAFSVITDIAMGPDGYLYACDSFAVLIKKVDTTTASATALPPVSDIQYALDRPQVIAFDKNGDLYVADASANRILIRNSTDNNYYPALPNPILDTLRWKVRSMSIDNQQNVIIVISDSMPSKLGTAERRLSEDGTVYSLFLDYSTTDLNLQNATNVISGVLNSNGVPNLWVCDKANNNVKLIGVFNYSITPPLPAGLSFNFNRGEIFGTPQVATPAQTYKIITQSGYGKDSIEINFSVDPPGPLSNVTGSRNSDVIKHSDGLTVKYFEKNNCAEMLEIKDNNGGSSPGNVKVTQTVYPTVASFNSGNFVGRVTEVEAQNPNAPTRMRLYFTHTDIENFNASNGTDPDLSNDTTGGTMQIGVLQLHTDNTGRKQQIKHNPITATWVTAKYWKVEFDLTKFSTFYASTTNTISSFDCSTTGSTTTASSCGTYIWRNKAYSASGTYKDTTVNRNGCDSILTLNLTVTNDITITQDNFVPEYLNCNESGATYQWINCDNGGIVLNGATSQDYTATANGSYSVIVTKNSCTDTSLCVTVTSLATITDLLNTNQSATVSVHPNPGNGQYLLHAKPGSQISVHSVYGETILETITTANESVLDLSKYSDGLYYLYIRTGDSSSSLKLVKQ
jgi:streptogramin lyase